MPWWRLLFLENGLFFDGENAKKKRKLRFKYLCGVPEKKKLAVTWQERRGRMYALEYAVG